MNQEFVKYAPGILMIIIFISSLIGSYFSIRYSILILALKKRVLDLYPDTNNFPFIPSTKADKKAFNYKFFKLMTAAPWRFLSNKFILESYGLNEIEKLNNEELNLKLRKIVQALKYRNIFIVTSLLLIVVFFVIFQPLDRYN